MTSETAGAPIDAVAGQIDPYADSAGGQGPPVPTDPAAAPVDLDDAEFTQPGADLYRLAVDLHEKGDLSKAADAYLHAEAAGINEAAFNLGVLLYDAGDYDGAEIAWTRCLAHRHARAATNLGFLFAQRGDLAHARMAYSAAELWGDPEARRLADELPSAHDA